MLCILFYIYVMYISPRNTAKGGAETAGGSLRYTHVFMCMCIYIYIHIHIHMYNVYTYIYIYIYTY